jgi:hypothetical protein
MLKVTIKKFGKDPKQHIQELHNRLQLVGQSEILNAAEETTEEMRVYISSQKKRPGGNNTLENALKNEPINTTGGISGGIGKISELKETAKHFEVLDAGGYVPPQNIGYFENFRKPETGGYGEQWFHTGKDSGFFRMTPNKPIVGIQYIALGFDKLGDLLKKAVDILNKEFKI